jgi:glycosyltransferase involved in cell wall biosynthesis
VLAQADAPLTDAGTHEPARQRLLMVITLAETGGAQTYVATLLPALVERFDVTVAAHGDGPLVSAARAAGAGYVPLRYLRRALNPVAELRAILELWRLCRRLRPSIVHLNSSKGIVVGAIAARLANVPVRVATVHGWPFKTETGVRRTVYTVATRLVRPLLTSVVCVAESERRAGIAAGTVRPAQAVVIPNGVSLPDVASDPSGRDVISVTRLRAPKDAATLVRAAARIRDELERVLVVGDGPERPQIEELARSLGVDDRIELLGDRDDVPELLARSSIFVLATLSEAMPMAVLEAMAAGLPTVASDVGGIPELIVDCESGLRVPPGDDAALAEALRRLLEDDELRARMGRAARERARNHFNLERTREEHLQLYESLLAGSVAA